MIKTRVVHNYVNYVVKYVVERWDIENALWRFVDTFDKKIKAETYAKELSEGNRERALAYFCSALVPSVVISEYEDGKEVNKN